MTDDDTERLMPCYAICKFGSIRQAVSVNHLLLLTIFNAEWEPFVGVLSKSQLPFKHTRFSNYNFICPRYNRATEYGRTF